MFDPGRESEFRALGKTWRVGRLELSVLEKFRDWVAEQEGDPFAGLERVIDRLPPAEAIKLVKEAEAKRDALRTLDLNDPLLQKWQATVRGMIRMLTFALQVNHPEVTPDITFQIAMEIGMIEASKAIARGAGQVQGNGQGPVNQPAPANDPTGMPSVAVFS